MIRTLLGRRGQDGGQVEQLADSGMSDHVVAVQRGVKVSRQGVKADLKVQDQHKLFFLQSEVESRETGAHTASLALRRSHGTAVPG